LSPKLLNGRHCTTMLCIVQPWGVELSKSFLTMQFGIWLVEGALIDSPNSGSTHKRSHTYTRFSILLRRTVSPTSPFSLRVRRWAGERRSGPVSHGSCLWLCSSTSIFSSRWSVLVNAFQRLLHYGDKDCLTWAYISTSWTKQIPRDQKGHAVWWSPLRAAAVASHQLHHAAMVWLVGGTICPPIIQVFLVDPHKINHWHDWNL
jgi:hypothetical protein